MQTREQTVKVVHGGLSVNIQGEELYHVSMLVERGHIIDHITEALSIIHLNQSTCADPGIFVRGGPGQKISSDNIFFFVVLSLFYRSQMVNFKEIYHFSRFKRGSNIFQGGSNFFKGGGGFQLLIPYRNPYNL